MRSIFRLPCGALAALVLLALCAGVASALNWYPSGSHPFRVMQLSPRETGWEAAGNETLRNLNNGVATAVAWMSYSPTQTPTSTPTPTATHTPTLTPTGGFSEYLRSDTSDTALGSDYDFLYDVSILGNLLNTGIFTVQESSYTHFEVEESGNVTFGNSVETGATIIVSGSVSKIAAAPPTQVSFLGGGLANASYDASGSPGYLYPSTPNTMVACGFALPYQVMGGTAKVTTFTVDYETTASGAYIDRIVLEAQTVSGVTTLLDYGTDLGNGSTGTGSQNLASTPFSMIDGACIVKVYPAGQSSAGDVRIIRFACEYHTE